MRTPVQMLSEARGGVLPNASVTGSSGCWESNADPLKEEHTLITPKPSLESHIKIKFL